MRGLGLTLASGYNYPTPESYAKPVTKPSIYRPELDPMCVLQPSGVYKCIRANGLVETYPGPSYPSSEPVTTSAPVITVAAQGDSGPFGLSGNTFKLILLGGLAYLILKGK